MGRRTDAPMSEHVDTGADENSATSLRYAVIDDALVRFRSRSLVSGAEVVDFLLDMRRAIDSEIGHDSEPAAMRG